MKTNAKILLSALFLATCAPEIEGNVILITLDGVRHQDVFDRDGRLRSESETAVMPYLTSARPNTFITDKVRVANEILVSLPAYESLMLGEVNGCKDNHCERVTEETLPERVQRELGLPHGGVATFAAWGRIASAVESLPKSTFVDAGTQGEASEGEDTTRMDEDTWPLAMDHLQQHHPRFMYISLNDPDNWAHDVNRDLYLQALREDDDRIKALEAMLKDMGEYGRHTTIIVTTDHGRGNDAMWGEHYASLPESAAIWMYATGPHVDPEQVTDATHTDIRPTVERLLGLDPARTPLAAIAGH